MNRLLVLAIVAALSSHPAAIAVGMRATFAVAAVLIVVALAVAFAGRALPAAPSRDPRRPLAA